MYDERTVTKIVFYDSSDDEEENNRRGACLAGSANAVQVAIPNMTMSEEDMIDPDAHLNIPTAGSDEEGEFVEDTVASARAARGEDNASRIQVAGMPIGESYNEDQIQEKAAKDPQFRRVTQVEEALSSLKRFREEGDEETAADEKGGSSFMKNICPDGVPQPVLLPGGRRIESDPVTDPSQVGWGDGVAERTELPDECSYPKPNYSRSVPMATHIVKITPEGYQLTLDEADVQDLLDEDEDLDESDSDLDDLIAVSAIEQLAAACRRYNPDEEGGGMCNQLDAEGEREGGETAAVVTAVAETAQAEETTPTTSCAVTPVATSTPVEGGGLLGEVVAEADGGDEDDDDVPVDKVAKKFRPRSFDEFANKADEWLRKLREGEVVLDEVCEALDDDMWRVESALKRLSAHKAAPIIIDGVKMDF